MEEGKKKIALEALEAVPFFPPLKEEEKSQLLEKLQIVEYPKGTVIFAQGDPGDFCYILAKGAIEVFTQEGNEKKVLAVLKDKELFGEMALVTGEPRSASVLAREDCQVVALNKNDFEQLLSSHPALAVNLTRVISRRLMNAARAAPEEKKGAQEIITIYSATGRCGKTTLAVSLAALLSRRGRKVLLADLNLQFGHLGLMLNIKPELTIHDLVQKSTIDVDLLTQHARETSYGFFTLFAPLHIAEAEVIEERKIVEILDLAKEQFDFIILDTGIAITPPTLAALDHATKVLYIFTPDMFSLRDAKECLDVMNTLEYPKEKIMLFKRNFGGADPHLANEKIEAFLGHKIVGEIPEEVQVHQTVQKAKIPVLELPKAAFTQALEKMAALFVEKEATPAPAKKSEGGLLKGLFSKK